MTMFVYFDKNGTLKEIITEKTFRVGDSKRDKIYVYWDGEHSPISGWVKYRKPDGTEYPISAEECFFGLGDSLVGKALPTKPLRNLSYFSYDHTYEEGGETKVGYKFYEITVPDAVLNVSNDDEKEPTQNNMVVARVRFVMDDGTTDGKVDEADSIETLGAIVFAVETNIGILTDSSINESQYNYLIALLSMKLGLNILSQKVSELPQSGLAGTIYYVEKYDNGIVYDAYFWNGFQFVFLGTTSYDLYTKQEGEDFKIAIQELWNAEFDDYQKKINGQMENFGVYIQAAASGSPKGVYDTLTALQTAYPTGAPNIYVVRSNNHWYYWNGSAWSDGGAYLADMVVDDFLSERSSNTVENKVISSAIQKNGWVSPSLVFGGSDYDVEEELLKDGVSFTDGFYLYSNTTVENPLACYTDYIKVSAYQRLYMAKGCGYTICGAYYDKDKAYKYDLILTDEDIANGGFAKYGDIPWICPADGFVRINVKIESKGFASLKSSLETNGRKKLGWLEVTGENVNGGSISPKEYISFGDGVPKIPFIRNHMWNKDGTLTNSQESLGSTETIPLHNAKSITVYPFYKYGQESYVGNGAFVDENGNYVSSIDDGAVWDSEHITFRTKVPENAFGVQLNAQFETVGIGKGERYNIAEGTATNPSPQQYVVLENQKKKLEWMGLGDGVIEPANFDTEPKIERHKISEQDGTPITPFIRSHMWMKDGSLFTSVADFGSTETIALNGTKSFTMLPLYKYGKEEGIDNGALVDNGGNWIAGLMANAVWDDSHSHLIVTAPTGAYGFQINATFDGGGTYSTALNDNVNSSRAIYYTSDFKIYVPWLKMEAPAIDWGSIPNGAITYDSLNADVKSRLSLPYDESYKYWDSLNKPFDFQGKTLVAFGDSITAGVANEGSGNYSAGPNSYINLFATKFGMVLHQMAISGSCITSGVNELTPICDKVDEYAFSNDANEFVFIAGGTNDFNSDAALGQLGDTQKTTFYGALDHICQKLKTSAPNSTVVFITPINVNTDYFPKKATGSTLTLNKYRNAIWEVSTKYGFNVVDGSTIGFAKEINTPWGNLMISHSDGTHPTLAGHALYFRGLCGKLK